LKIKAEELSKNICIKWEFVIILNQKVEEDKQQTINKCLEWQNEVKKSAEKEDLELQKCFELMVLLNNDDNLDEVNKHNL